jgi:hypothetical protein
MKVLRVPVIATMTVLMAGCGGTPACLEPQPYESSQAGKRIEAPEGLDQLNAGREMTIPEASPRPPRADNAPCLEYPPSFGTEASEEATGTDGG